MKSGQYVFLVTISLLWTNGLSAAVYKSVDAQGNVIYTDVPSGDAKPVDLPPLSTVPPPRQESSEPLPADAAHSSVATEYQHVSIASPTQEETLRDNTGAVPVTVVTEPELNSAAGHRFRYYLDGQAQGRLTESGRIIFENLDRGEHTVQAAIVDGSGRELIRSGSVKFFLHRQSVNFPRGPGSPTPRPITTP